MEKTATVTGVSIGWACQLRNRFIRDGGIHDATKPTRGGRRREKLSREEEVTFLAPFIEKAAAGGVLIVSEIKQALDARLKRKTSPAAAYHLLHRHGWRKLAPDKRHPKADALAQDKWKKLHETLIEIDQEWQAERILRLMFQDEARFGRVSDTRRGWCPKPIYDHYARK
jgi:transposase